MSRHSGAGDSKEWDALQGTEPGTHWFNLRETWVNQPDDFLSTAIPYWWRQAIQAPGKRIEVDFANGKTFAQYDPERKQILAKDHDCPIRYNHHLYMTCWCCGQYG